MTPTPKTIDQDHYQTRVRGMMHISNPEKHPRFDDLLDRCLFMVKRNFTAGNCDAAVAAVVDAFEQLAEPASKAASIGTLGLSVEFETWLNISGFETIEDVLAAGIHRLRVLPRFHTDWLSELNKALNTKGFTDDDGSA